MDADAPPVERMMKRLFGSLEENNRRRYAANRVRRNGRGPLSQKRCGRKRLIDIDPVVEANFPKVLEDHTAGDPTRVEVI